MLAINKISTKSIKYDTKLCTYDTTYDTKISNLDNNLCYGFLHIAQKIELDLCKHTNYAH